MIFRNFKLWGFILTIPILLILVFSCEFKRPKPNIILIVPDALRAKQLPLYGYENIETPNIDKLAEESVIFNSCFVRSPWTTASFSCLFSGLLFPSFGLIKEEKSLAQFLKEEGFLTVGAVSSHVLWSYESRKINKFDKGFDKYIQDDQLKKRPYFRENEKTTQDVLRELENIKDTEKPFFLFVHYMDPHFPYDPNYDREIEKIDKEVEKIIHKLKSLKLYDNSMVLFTSDHGESLGDTKKDHGFPRGHGWSLHTEQIRVPLIIKFPGSKYVKSIKQIVRLIDLTPTILDYIGINYHKDDFDGKSLLPAIKRNEDLGLKSIHLGQSHRVCPEGSLATIFKYKGEKFHFIKGKFSEQNQKLYNITKDPGERKNLVHKPEYSKIKVKAQKFLEKFKEKIKEKEEEGELQTLEIKDQERLRALKALGYLGGGAPAPTVWKRAFLMQKKVPSMGQLKYFCKIRQLKWGIKNWDKYYPIKIIPLDKNRFYIISNENRELFEYDLKDGFSSMEVQNIKDMTNHPHARKIYLLKKDGIFTLDRNKRTINKWKKGKIHSLGPIQSIYIDAEGNFYLFKDQTIIKLDEDGNRRKTFNFRQKNSSLFCVDNEENMYLVDKNTILKYNQEGKRIKSFSIGSRSKEISYICMDGKERIWALEKSVPRIHIFNSEGDRISSFMYNKYKSSRMGRHWTPVPTKQIYFKDKLFIIDNWEVILVYSLN